MKSKSKTLKSGPSSSQLIWNIFSWLKYHKNIDFSALISRQGEHIVSLNSKESGFNVNLSSRSSLLEADCILTWWANMGIDHNENENGENIFDFDLTKKKNRDKFTA